MSSPMVYQSNNTNTSFLNMSQHQLGIPNFNPLNVKEDIHSVSSTLGISISSSTTTNSCSISSPSSLNKSNGSNNLNSSTGGTSSQSPLVLSSKQSGSSSSSSSSSNSIILHNSASGGSSSLDDKIGLKEKEEVARVAYKSWFVIKPGNKEVKDKWWSLYYTKILPKFHLRDNHLGRKINQWIEEDMKELEKKNGGNSSSSGNEDDSTESGKKRKPNSTKEGTQPAYINVQLVNPDPNTDSENVKLLSEYCINKSIFWTEPELETLIAIFKENRIKIMDNIISQTKKKSNSNLTSPNTTPLLTCSTPSALIPQPSSNNNSNNNNNNNSGILTVNNISGGDSPVLKHALSSPFKSGSKKHKKNKVKNETNAYFVSTNYEWVNGEIAQSNDFYWVKLDLPGIENNITIKTDETNNKIIIGSTRFSDETVKILATNGKKKYGNFEIEAYLPNDSNVLKYEKMYINGVLSLKVPIIQSQTPQQPSQQHLTQTPPQLQLQSPILSKQQHQSQQTVQLQQHLPQQ
ncbi:hypothetical protein DICPUDRAFT_99031 [Dictyostelium purpureum]|uniref:SHSP domain-containing protein n=1 Tax=Dictyostelium purpureum TaxID=5786 RepID=F0ZVN2_DICPU|nr:uncharacterized protein DICPUDRAFT_99031 [Dictyostelium purpureum]EGC32020.1 hypothetical protein DICPUDRAFT_99031 [Dictyostelium purpureum]|eukprot:XP_003291476.1 hypothetical protein DICPUDRAFT_99031 [Dictyostelium purpureum]